MKTVQTQTEIIVAGHICLDVIPTFEEHTGDLSSMLVPGKLVNVGKVILSTGGSVANTGLALHRLGIPTRLMGKVGADQFGELIRDILRQQDETLANGMIVDPDSETSYSIVISPPGIDRIFFHNPGANDTFQASDIQFEQLHGARYFHFGYPPLMQRMYMHQGSAMADLLEHVKATGLTTSLDLAQPDPETASGKIDWRRWLKNVLPQVDIFLPSLDEILYMLDRPQFEASRQDWLKPALLSRLAEDVLEMGAAIVVFKLGNKGLYLKSTPDMARLEAMGTGQPIDLRAWQGITAYTPCFNCNVVGTTGAGDCTIAGFLSAISKDLPPTEVMTYAVAVGGFNVESADATSGIPSWDTVKTRIQNGWEKQPPVFQV
jgi:sugar/nucleoside kinase (ribokinase family)